MHVYSLIPQDVLYFGRGRSWAIEAERDDPSSSWPVPSVVFDALHAALHRAFPQVTLWEQTHAFHRGAQQSARNQRFGSLTTLGPFPCWEKSAELQWFFPTPGDVLTENGFPRALLAPVQESGRSNLPSPLRYSLGSPAVMGEAAHTQWWSKTAIESYLAQRMPDPPGLWNADELYETEYTFGANLTATAIAAHMENPSAIHYLRLKEQVSLGLAANMPLHDAHKSEGLDHLLDREDLKLLVGGRQKICRVRPIKVAGLETLLPMSTPIIGDRVKWLLLSPAIFPAQKTKHNRLELKDHPGGWLPSWVCPETGRVLLKKGDLERRLQESRTEWRKRIRDLTEAFECRLVAARIPPPLVISGWSERKHQLVNVPEAGSGPKPTWLAVPAGAVFYFEGPDAAPLADALAWHGTLRQDIQAIQNRRSALMGEKGFGIGVCGPWKFVNCGTS